MNIFLYKLDVRQIIAGTEAKQADLIWVFVEELYELLVEDAAANGVSHSRAYFQTIL